MLIGPLYLETKMFPQMTIVSLEGVMTNQPVLSRGVDECHAPIRCRTKENERQAAEHVFARDRVQVGRQKFMSTVGHHRWW